LNYKAGNLADPFEDEEVNGAISEDEEVKNNLIELVNSQDTK
jgi:hypothetical protein